MLVYINSGESRLGINKLKTKIKTILINLHTESIVFMNVLISSEFM